MEILGYIASILMGLTLGMIGGGGSILTVPILVYLFQINPVIATAYSLFIVGLTALVGGGFYLKKGEVDLKTGFVAIPSFIGVYLTRAYVMPQLPDPVFTIASISFAKPLLIMIVFAVLMVAASLSMIKSKTSNVSSPKEMKALNRLILISLEGLVVGAITGFVGAGGGFLIIPALVILVGLPMKIAVGTSLFIIACKVAHWLYWRYPASSFHRLAIASDNFYNSNFWIIYRLVFFEKSFRKGIEKRLRIFCTYYGYLDFN